MDRAAPDIVIKPFSELTLDELYSLLALRSKVFVVEQNCVYQDIDGLDRDALHVFIKREDGSILACARICFFGDTAKIGRVIADERGLGHGMRVLTAAAEQAKRLGARLICVEAQQYAVGFYEKAGFRVAGEVFLEDGIPHVRMELPPAPDRVRRV